MPKKTSAKRTAKPKTKAPKVPSLRQWVNALKTERWPQCNGVLLNLNEDSQVDAACCMGVCTLLTKADIDITPLSNRAIAVLPKSLGGRLHDGDLPHAIIKKMFKAHGQKVDEKSFASLLVDLNDNENWNFPDIAEAIRFAAKDKSVRADNALREYMSQHDVGED